MAGENRLETDPVTPAGTAAASEPAAFKDLAASMLRSGEEAARDALFLTLHREPWLYSFYHAVRLIECLHPQQPRIGTSQKPVDDPVRFCQQPTLAFPPATVSAFDLPTPEHAPRMYVNFLGLLGPNGPLPLHITEYIHQRNHLDHDATLARFLDAMIHRHVSLFYRAWAVNQQAVSFDRAASSGSGGDKYATYIGSLFGIAMETYRNRDAMSDWAKLHYSGRLAGATRNAEGLRALVADYFGLETRLVEFVGEWIDLPADSRCRLGESRATGTLGLTAIAGSRVWQCQYKFRLRLGPMSYTEYERLLPGGKSLARLEACVNNYVGDELSWDVQLSLQKANVPVCQLGKLGRLGWSTWMMSQPMTKDVDDLILNPCAMHMDHNN